MRFKNVGLSASVVVLGILLPAAVHASVIGVSVSETAEADATHTATNATLPPIDLNEVNADGSNEAIVTISTYSGPSGVGSSTPTLTLDGSLFTIEGEGTSTEATIVYTFNLDATQPYSYSVSGSNVSVSTFNGPDGSVARGSGSLDPGQYTLTESSEGGGTSGGAADFNLSVTAAVPEPASLGALALVGLLGLRSLRAR
jgi:hypothetical protein